MTADSDRDWRTLIQRAEMNVDHAALERRKREQAERAADERIAYLRRVLFEGANRTTAHGLTSESVAAKALTRASKCVHSFLILDIVRVAIDNQWHDVVRAGIRYFGDAPTAHRIREIYEHNLTADNEAI